MSPTPDKVPEQAPDKLGREWQDPANHGQRRPRHGGKLKIPSEEASVSVIAVAALAAFDLKQSLRCQQGTGRLRFFVAGGGSGVGLESG